MEASSDSHDKGLIFHEESLKSTDIKQIWCDQGKGTLILYQKFAFEAKYTAFSKE